MTSVIEMKIGYNLKWSGGNLRPNDSFPVTNSLRDFLLGIILSQRGNLLFFVLNNVPESMPHLEQIFSLLLEIMVGSYDKYVNVL